MPISLGHDDSAKQRIIAAYRAAHGIQRVVVIAPDAFPLVVPDADQVRYEDVTMYVTFYRLLQEIDTSTLLVLNECLRTQNRYDLSYNCIRQYLTRTQHQLVFQYLPQIDGQADFMTLFDFDTQSRWKRRGYDPALIASEAAPCIVPRVPTIRRIPVPTTPATKQRYVTERDKLFDTLGKRDPHIIPRQLALIGGADKLAYIKANDLPLFGEPARYVARNARLKRADVVSYDAVEAGQTYTLVEFPHRFIDFCDFLATTRQPEIAVLVADLPVDHWYAARYEAWTERMHATYASLHP